MKLASEVGWIGDHSQKLYCYIKKNGTNDGTPESHARNDGNTYTFSSLPDGYPPSNNWHQLSRNAGQDESLDGRPSGKDGSQNRCLTRGNKALAKRDESLPRSDRGPSGE
jgi:hypothetical protein